MSGKFKKIELTRLLSKRGVCSRSKAPQLIRSGSVTVNGVVIRDASVWVSEGSTLLVDGQRVERDLVQDTLILLNKPRGYVTTTSDEKGRSTVFDLLPEEFKSLKAIGRLDMATTGLLLFTDNNKLADWLTDPKNQIPREYVVTVDGMVDEKICAQFLHGIEDNGEILRAQKVEIKKTSFKESSFLMTLTEGKNREIRRLCEACGFEVTALKRIRFGSIELGDVPSGKIKILSQRFGELFSDYMGVP